jgi:hypothetical protein
MSQPEHKNINKIVAISAAVLALVQLFLKATRLLLKKSRLAIFLPGPAQ